MNPHDRFVVRNIQFEYDGSVQIHYIEPKEDVFTNGVVASHVLSVKPDDQYEDGVYDITSAAQVLLLDVLTDMPFMEHDLPFMESGNSSKEDEGEDEDEDDC